MLRSFTYTQLDDDDEENFTERIIIIIDLFGGTASAVASLLLKFTFVSTNPGELSSCRKIKRSKERVS